MANSTELLNGHVTLEVECRSRPYLHRYIGPLATSGGLVAFVREQLWNPIPSQAVLGQVTERFREAVKSAGEDSDLPSHASRTQGRCRQPNPAETRDSRRHRLHRVAQEKAQASQGKKVNGRFEFT
ncbi:MAG: hypothetical protein ABSH56_04605 [Bryobacteraceae bacterium]|jgi:hypothetical protein